MTTITTPTPSLQAEAEANAAHIVKCVNAHDELVAALTLLVNGDGMCVQDSPLHIANMDVARAVLAKVQS